jgi:hypothetical protein
MKALTRLTMPLIYLKYMTKMISCLKKINSVKKQKFIILNWTFSGFPYFLILYIVIYAATIEGTGFSDLISAIYLFFALYYVV